MAGRVCWDGFFMDQAKAYAERSRDPSTKCGAVLVDPISKVVVSAGYNGFPRGVATLPSSRWERTEKLQRIVHAEVNCLLNAARQGVSTNGRVLYVCTSDPNFGLSCSNCAAAIIQAGVRQEFVENFNCPDRWKGNVHLGLSMLGEAGVVVTQIQRVYD